LLNLLLFLAFHSLTHFGRHLTPYFVRRIFANVRHYDCDLTRFNFLCAFGNYFEQQRIDVIGTRQQDVLLWSTLAALTNELVSVLEVVMSGK